MKALTAAPPQRILVATDMSVGAGLAVARAAQIAREHRADLTVLHVLPAGIDTDLVDCARGDLEAHLDRYLDSISAEAVIRLGSAAYEIAKEASERETDLVVVGTHGANWIADPSVGSTSDNVVRISPAALLMVKEPVDAAYQNVVIAVDDSAAAANAAHFAAALTPSATHTLIHVCVVVGEKLMRMHGIAEEEIATLRKTCMDDTREYLSRLAAALSPPSAKVAVETGHPPSQVVDYCRSHSADLAVVGTGARTPLAYALLGSVAQQLMRRAPSDVLVVPAPKD